VTWFKILFLGMLAFLPLGANAGSLLKKSEGAPSYDFREGDIVFQGNAGPQSDAVRAATGSPYTHCGLVFKKDGEFMVLEAIHPVQVTTLERFIERSLPGSFHARRLKHLVAPASFAIGREWAIEQAGLPYDLQFQWDDKKLYCSEFVWKAYDKAGVKLCERRPFRSYNLQAPAVKKIIDQRYGGLDKLPLDEPAVAPGDLADSPILMEVPRLP
jgi:hypothetical protein